MAQSLMLIYSTAQRHVALNSQICSTLLCLMLNPHILDTFKLILCMILTCESTYLIELIKLFEQLLKVLVNIY